MSEYSGTYTIIDNKQLICNANTIIHTDTSSNRNSSFKLTFKIINSNKLQLESISKKKFLIIFFVLNFSPYHLYWRIKNSYDYITRVRIFF